MADPQKLTEYSITLEQLKLYSECSGDDNPIHLDEAAAKAMGLPGIISHGMYNHGMISRELGRLIRGKYKGFCLDEINTRFSSMAFLGDKIEIFETVLSQKEDQVLLQLKASKKDSGEVVCSSKIKLKPKLQS